MENVYRHDNGDTTLMVPSWVLGWLFAKLYLLLEYRLNYLARFLSIYILQRSICYFLLLNIFPALLPTNCPSWVAFMLSSSIKRVYENYVLHSSRKIQVFSLSAAVLFTTIYLGYRQITVPPKNLRHLPCVNNLRFIWALFSKWPIHDIAKKITIPTALQSEHGIYVVSSCRSCEYSTSRSKVYIPLWSRDLIKYDCIQKVPSIKLSPTNIQNGMAG